MKAVVLEENSKLRLVERSRPEVKRGECLVRVRSAGICSSDVPRAFGHAAHRYPLVMGHELSGEITACGPGVTQLRCGDRVVVFPLIPCRNCDCCLERAYVRCRDYDYYGSRRDGAFAEELAVQAWNILPVPSEVSLADASLVEPCAVALHALSRLGVLPDLDVGPAAPRGELLILGAGFLGLAAVEMLRLKHSQVPVTVVDRNTYKLDRISHPGATAYCVNSHSEWEDFLEKHADRFRYVLEATGSPRTFAASIRLARPGGHVVWMGNIAGDLHLPQALVSSVLRKELNLAGTWNAGYDGAEPSDWTATLALLSAGFQPSALVTHTVDLDALPGLLEQMYDQKQHRGAGTKILKAIVRPGAS